MRRDRNLEKLTSLVENCATYAHRAGLFKCGSVEMFEPMRSQKVRTDQWGVKIKSEGGDETMIIVTDAELDTFKTKDMTADILTRFRIADTVLCRKRDEMLSVGAGI